MSDVGTMVTIPPHEPEDTEDPDIHATLREFVDYTEYLPSDLFRSLQLIRSLDAQEADHRGHLEWLTKEFANLHAPPPTANGFGRTVTDEEMEVRLQISRSINASIRTRQESAAEATKLHQNIDRHFSRITAIRTKLDDITIPSRDPTPISPRKPRALEKSEDPQCRITLRLNSDRTPAPPSTRGGRRRAYTATPRSRLPPITPAGNEDDWEDIPDSVYPSKPKKKKPPTGAPKRGPKPPTDPPFSGGAPARYEDGTPIPAHLLPWNRLTNEELARLRKRMKKNSGWTPSVTMIIRELESLGRGPKHKDAFLEQTEGRLGEDFLKIYGPEDGGIGDPEKIAPDDGAGVRENKGMRLNRAKKRKREEERKEKERELERERHEAEERERVKKAEEEEERKEKERIAREAREKAAREAAAREAAAAAAAAEAAEKERLAREAREAREEKVREKAALKEKERAAALMAASSRKMRSASISTVTTNTGTTTTTTSNSNTASVEADEGDEEMPDADAPPPPPRRLGRPPKNPPAFKAGHKRAASTTTPAGAPLIDSKRSKRIPADAPAPRTKPTARKKGLVAGGRRGTIKKSEGAGTEAAGSEQEWVDEDEEDLNRYCLCDEVSRGTMVACENPQCPKVWFHIECVGLKEEEATTKLKWFCPYCSEDIPGKRGGKRRKKV